MKKVLVLVLSSDFPPYDQMLATSINTWDSVFIEGVETIFYCSQLDNLDWRNSSKIMYLPVGNSIFDMNHKNVAMFEWILQNKEFDYVARVNASVYVDKRKLIEYVQNIPESNLFSGVQAESQNGFIYLWGGTNFLISKDVIQKIVDNKKMIIHKYMEDEGLSLLVSQLGIPFENGIKSCSIDQQNEGWLCISYCGESLTFTDFNDLKDKSHFFYRVKCDGKRWVDKFLMEQLYSVLK